MFRSLSRVAVLGLGLLALTACTPPHPVAKTASPLRAITALDCPQEQGDLTLKTAASDGQSCLYADDGGSQVTLQLVKYAGDNPQTALDPIEAKLKAELPPDADADSSTTASATADKGAVDINLPGIHIQAHDKGKDGAAKVSIGGGGMGDVNIDARHGSARVEVDARGAGVRRVYILTTDHPGPNGYKVVGYEAAGPSGGPLVVASMMAKDDDSLRDEMSALLKHNVGG